MSTLAIVIIVILSILLILAIIGLFAITSMFQELIDLTDNYMKETDKIFDKASKFTENIEGEWYE